nr:MAG TPA: hypothetical protein [Caudoviricetes sp.]
MERTEITGKDVIIHRDLTPKEREEELRRLKEESENLKSWEEDGANGSE